VNRQEFRNALPPGPTIPGPIQLLATWKRPAASLERLRQRYGPRVTVQLPFQPPFVILSDPDEIKELFTAAPDALHPGEGARVLEPLVGRNSVILLDEAPHLEQRKLLLPAFHGAKTQRLTGLMSELATREVDSWPIDQPVALHVPLQRVTLEIILRAVFGLDQGPRLNQLRDLLTNVLRFSESPLSVLPAVRQWAWWVPAMRRFEKVSAATDRMLREVIEERRAEGESDRDDVLAMLLTARHEDGSPMSEEELRDELLTALVAGHETTASQLAWAFEQLAREPAVVARLAAEADAGESDEYLTATVNEILRRKPVLPNAEPRLTKREITIGSFTYPKGVALLASAYLVHHDPTIYPEPYAFRPERFLGVTPGTYTWIPFGGGRRRCLGASFALQEMKIVLREVVSRFELVPGTKRREQTGRRGITFSPSGGATVVLHPRARPERTPGPPAELSSAA
jgi:cytochrome P450